MYVYNFEDVGKYLQRRCVYLGVKYLPRQQVEVRYYMKM